MISALFTLAMAASMVAAGPSHTNRSPSHRRSHVFESLALRGEGGVKPVSWWTGLEEYHGYHIRYMAISCQTQHNTTFFDDCCHPMIKSETLAKDRKPYCSPSAQASSSASAVEPSRSVSLVTTPPAGMTSAPVASATSSASDDEDCEEEEDEDEEDCEDEDESSAAPSATPAPTSSKAPASSSVAPTFTHVSSAKFTTSKVASSTAAATQSAAAPVKNAAVESSSSTKTPEPTKSATPTTSSKAAESTKSSDSGLITGGRATFFSQGGNAGACGVVHPDSDSIVAIAFASYGNLGQKSEHCGKTVEITNTKTGKTTTATVADACEACSTESLDLSTGLFAKLGGVESDGIFPISWKYTGN